MTTLVVGASGSTGKHLVDRLLETGHTVKVIVRSTARIPKNWKNNDAAHIIEANVLDISEDEMAEHVKDCTAVASCLGHNITRKGLFGEPKKLVTDAVILLCNAIKKNEADEPIRFALMNTTANLNRDLNEPNSIGQRITTSLLRLLLPPHVDNEKAADFLRTKIGQDNDFIEWVAIRPYGLIDEDVPSEYEVHSSPSRPAMFDPRKTRRINVGHFMAELMTNSEIWNKWKGQMPVILDRTEQNS
ncbi:MAG: SDR family oxidoreductase [Flavobacteriales bacterium]|nr:SDR family oxidoreductase [Flavobacteriales bacterium]